MLGAVIAGALATTVLVEPLSSQTPLLVHGTPVEVGSESRRVFMADVNGDRRADLVVLLRGGTVAVRLGDGSGRFSAGPTTGLASDPGAVALADVSADGILDLVVAWRDAAGEYVATSLGTGGGRFGPRQPAARLGAALEYYKPFVRVLDLNEDGVMDLVAGNERGPGFHVLLGIKQGRFTAPEIVRYEPAGAEFYSCGFADIDDDGHLDVVLTSTFAGPAGSGLLVRRGNGRGGFAGRLEMPLSVAGDPRVGAIGDLNGDAAPDLVVTHPEQRVLDVLFNDGRGRFTPAPWSPLRARLPATAVAIADATGDARPDLVLLTVNSVVKPYESELDVRVSSARGFAPAPGSPFPVGPGAFALAAGDVNGDGRMDLATSSGETGLLTLLLTAPSNLR